MRKIFLILAAIVLTSVNVLAQNDNDESDSLEYEFKPNFCTWSVILDVEATTSGIGMYNIGLVGGVNFANDHLFYGAGFAMAYASREEVSHEEISSADKGADKTVTVIDTYGIDKTYFCIAMHLRYHVLPTKKVSPLMQLRIAKALNERSSNYKTAEIGVCINVAEGRHALSLTGGICRLDYNVGTSMMEYESMAVINLGFKF
ncbi:MAG: hypothetical protein K6F33_07360 [Bacteroidales bacterium]|nr:hypothetical protein [Bacteroidales bacterium]